jgi:adenosylcobinamide-GDP ribazoletransferase
MPHLAADLRPRPADLIEALSLLTRLPVPAAVPRGAPSAWAWPLVGALVGALAGAVAAVAMALELGAGVAAAVALVAQAALTGAFHEDGLADCADGFWGGRTPERRLEIMRDSRVGSFGALALVLSVLLRWSALSALAAAGWTWGPLIAAGALSRWPMAWVLGALPPARPGGLAAAVGRPGAATLALGGGVALVAALASAGWPALGSAAAALAAGAGWGLLARAKLGGQTGDVCGGAQQVAEVAALLALLALR